MKKKGVDNEPLYKRIIPDSEQLDKIKKILAHVGLYVGLVAYTAIGAKVLLYNIVILSFIQSIISKHYDESSNFHSL